MQLKMGGKFHLKLNIGERPIANKYREGKMKRTLKRELKVPETAEREANRVYCPFACIACCGPRATGRCVAVESESVPSPRPGSGDKGRNPA